MEGEGLLRTLRVWELTSGFPSDAFGKKKKKIEWNWVCHGIAGSALTQLVTVRANYRALSPGDGTPQRGRLLRVHGRGSDLFCRGHGGGLPCLVPAVHPQNRRLPCHLVPPFSSFPLCLCSAYLPCRCVVVGPFRLWHLTPVLCFTESCPATTMCLMVPGYARKRNRVNIFVRSFVGSFVCLYFIKRLVQNSNRKIQQNQQSVIDFVERNKISFYTGNKSSNEITNTCHNILQYIH